MIEYTKEWWWRFFFRIQDREMLKFVHECDPLYSGRLSSSINYSRVVALAHFERLVGKFQISPAKIAVVSGSEKEFELTFCPNADANFFNYESNDKWDLSNEWDISQRHDLVICNQVLEHVFNPFQAVKNLKALCETGGYIWITVPGVNMIHSDPHFYFSGFHPRFMAEMAKSLGLTICEIGFWSSSKYAAHSVFSSWRPEVKLRRGFRALSDLRAPLQMFKDGRRYDDGDGRHISEVWILLKK